jgi:hypothetical protein
MQRARSGQREKEKAMGFAYHGTAVAFGARLERPVPDIIPSQASAVLAPAGGEGMAVVRNFDYKGIISFDEARSYVAGSFEKAHAGEPEDSYNTLATVTIRNLNVGNMLLADSIVARVSSKHVVKAGVIADEGEITFDGSLIEGVRIAGLRGNINLDAGLFARYPTFTSFTNDFPHDDQFAEKAHLFWGRETVKKSLKRRRDIAAEGKAAAIPQPCAGVVSCSLFAGMTHGIPTRQELQKAGKRSNVYRDGFGVTIGEFGTIYFAEVVMKRGQRRLNMLRFNLGCPLTGDGSGGSVEGNGTPTVP